MQSKIEEWPRIGDLVMATVDNVTDYGAYVKLDEYDKRGLLHISEISSSWVRNIRNLVRERQKVVLKVIRVDRTKGHINVSLRRVTKRERIAKVKSWRRERKADVLLKSAAEEVGLTFEEIYERAGALMEQEYGLYDAFEKAAKEGVEVFTDIGIPPELAATLAGIAKERVRTPMVRVKGIVELSCMKSNGVEIIKEAFRKAGESEKLKDVNFRSYVMAAPKYRIEVMAEDYKRAETVLHGLAEKIVSSVVGAGGKGSFEREK